MNIKLIHILNNPEGEREKKSISNLSKLKNNGVNYIKQITPLYNGDSWKTPTSSGIIHSSKGHYGLYESYKRAIKENFTEDLDALIICECDSMLIDSIDFKKEITKTLEFCEKHNIYHFSWGGRLVNNYEQGLILDIDNNYPNYAIVNKIIEAHFVILTKQSRDFYLSNINNIEWDSADIWLNELLYKNNIINKQATVMNKLSYQQIGKSLLDNEIKGDETVKFYDFKIDYNIKNNKIFIEYNNIINVDIFIYKWEIKTRNIELLYKTNSEFNNNKLWYSTKKPLNEINYIKIEIKFNDKLIFYRYLKINI